MVVVAAPDGVGEGGLGLEDEIDVGAGRGARQGRGRQARARRGRDGGGHESGRPEEREVSHALMVRRGGLPGA